MAKPVFILGLLAMVFVVGFLAADHFLTTGPKITTTTAYRELAKPPVIDNFPPPEQWRQTGHKIAYLNGIKTVIKSPEIGSIFRLGDDEPIRFLQKKWGAIGTLVEISPSQMTIFFGRSPDCSGRVSICGSGRFTTPDKFYFYIRETTPDTTLAQRRKPAHYEDFSDGDYVYVYVDSKEDLLNLKGKLIAIFRQE